MTERAATRRKHGRRCGQCRRRFAPTSAVRLCPRCLSAAGHAAVYASDWGCPLPPPVGKKRMVPDARGGAGFAALDKAHRKHVRPHRPGKEP